jgi:hypothetical protein
LAKSGFWRVWARRRVDPAAAKHAEEFSTSNSEQHLAKVYPTSLTIYDLCWPISRSAEKDMRLLLRLCGLKALRCRTVRSLLWNLPRPLFLERHLEYTFLHLEYDRFIAIRSCGSISGGIDVGRECGTAVAFVSQQGTWSCAAANIHQEASDISEQSLLASASRILPRSTSSLGHIYHGELRVPQRRWHRIEGKGWREHKQHQWAANKDIF